MVADIFVPFYVVYCNLRIHYYPLKDLFGAYGIEICHFMNFAEILAVLVAQFHSFFLTSFRYICLFHDDVMTKFNVGPKLLGQLKVSLYYKELFESSIRVNTRFKNTFFQRDTLW